MISERACIQESVRLLRAHVRRSVHGAHVCVRVRTYVRTRTKRTLCDLIHHFSDGILVMAQEISHQHHAHRSGYLSATRNNSGMGSYRLYSHGTFFGHGLYNYCALAIAYIVMVDMVMAR